MPLGPTPLSTERPPGQAPGPEASAAASAAGPLGPDDLARAREVLDRVSAAFATRVVGQESLRTALLVALMAEGHVLVESVPGLAKTLASATLAEAVGARFSRIQCTPDLLPSDIVGTQVYDPRHHTFETQLGPVHANIVLLDEINRASAKTQSAMLEAMQEHQTSIAGEVHPLPRPFLVLATQNPLEEEGTYILPQAQMDRFLLKSVLDYPTVDDELAVLDRVDDGTLGRNVAPADAVVDPATVLELQSMVDRVYVDPAVRRYIVEVVGATRAVGERVDRDLGAYVETGASPRASIAFFQVARALAVLHGRHYVVPEDVRELRQDVLRHRLHLSFEALADRVRPETVVDAVFASVPTP